MSAPTEQHQIQILRKLQRLLSEGVFVASYKYALLLALADLAVERGDDSGAPLEVPLISTRNGAPFPASGALPIFSNGGYDGRRSSMTAPDASDRSCTI